MTSPKPARKKLARKNTGSKKTVPMTDGLQGKAKLTNDRILAAAIRIIAREGIEKVTTRRIAAEAKVANGLVMHYLKSRDLLFSKVIAVIATEAYEKIEAAPDELEGEKKIDWMVDKNLTFFLDQPDYAKCFLLFYYLASITPSFSKMNMAMDQRAIERLKHYCEQTLKELNRPHGADDVQAAAELLHAQIIVAVIKYFATPHEFSKEDYQTHIRDNIRRLIRHLPLR